MKSKEKIGEVLSSMESMNYTGLSVAEQGILTFTKAQLKKILESADSLEQGVDSKSWDDVIVNFLNTVQRVNLLYAYLMQPSVISSLMSGKIWEIAEKVLERISDLMGEVIVMLRRNLKDMGVESLSVSLNSSPPSFNVSIVMKNA
ncbi:hypothetical protein [Metallosphaera hakonensis]|uniref:Uncharacterized protein n=1 Tax=Metallosphaera hakonensis JCM 8857 = DSM 7519 TaxID=1293036 RepID=A0A2U9IUD7_9CREN|nr:hypothetical protein [Metallosphaera hakonensis]AWR99656.1 hypothetical protein DFR87_08090 [Metallosphaera hakonensis JCM 8857 = DSM 7519]